MRWPATAGGSGEFFGVRDLSLGKGRGGVVPPCGSLRDRGEELI